MEYYQVAAYVCYTSVYLTKKGKILYVFCLPVSWYEVRLPFAEPKD